VTSGDLPEMIPSTGGTKNDEACMTPMDHQSPILQSAFREEVSLHETCDIGFDQVEIDPSHSPISTQGKGASPSENHLKLPPLVQLLNDNVGTASPNDTSDEDLDLTTPKCHTALIPRQSKVSGQYIIFEYRSSTIPMHSLQLY